MSGRVPDTTGYELNDYLHRFIQLEDGISYKALISAFVLYFRYPLIAVLLGFSSVGVILLPLVTVTFAFFLSFSVCCFTAVFGSNGVLLALAVFGIRCLITLPCYFLLAESAWETSAALALASFGRGRRAVPIHYGRVYVIRFAICTAVLLAGVCLELFTSGWLLQLALGRVLT